MKFTRNDYFFDFKSLTLQHKNFKYKKKEFTENIIKSRKKKIFTNLMFYSKTILTKRLKLQKFFLSQLFLENKKIFKLVGFVNRTFLKKMFLKKKSIDNVLVSIERRLDLNLVRSRFLPSTKMAQQAIKYGYVYVNKQKMTSDKYLLKQYDVVTINPNFFFLTTLPYIQSNFVRYKLKRDSYLQFNTLLKNTYNLLLKNFNSNVFNILLNKTQLSIFVKIQIILLMSVFFLKKTKLTRKILLNKFFSKFYYINKVKSNYNSLSKLNRKK